MKIIFIGSILFLVFYKSSMSQPVSWFISAGTGLTKLSPVFPTGRQLLNKGCVNIGTVGINIPLSQSCRPIVKAALGVSSAYFFHSEVPFYTSSYLESYSVKMNCVTLELSFIYNLINRKVKISGGVGANLQTSWNKKTEYRVNNANSSYNYSSADYLIIAPQWLSICSTVGIYYNRFQLDATSDLRSVITEGNCPQFYGSLYCLRVGFNISKNKRAQYH
ncbi:MULTISPECIES: hypothetical protein [Niastella]|uniref:Outer membrane protein beta-barrel domain-containing protein n=1 Tax=Niastella soli TaxID=2821487 RepID=A0ABS3Z2D8_9BACT|nr:hypothetical protein [Niastella soli]MBO9204193.1 hypothetical protein [Niastella soli]